MRGETIKETLGVLCAVGEKYACIGVSFWWDLRAGEDKIRKMVEYTKFR
jgi:hypothetical protein